MVLFLSTGMLEKLSEELVAGGYQEETPAAIVYKATWPEEKVMHWPSWNTGRNCREGKGHQDCTDRSWKCTEHRI